MKSSFFLISLFTVHSAALAASTYQFIPIPAPENTAQLALPYAPVLNNTHQVALNYYDETNSVVPYIWSNGTFTSLGFSTGFTQGGATAINDAGLVVGYETDKSNLASTPVVWNTTTPTILDQQNQPFGIALTINNNNQIGGSVGQYFGGVGTYGGAASISSAVLWNGTTVTNLGVFGSDQAAVTAINNNGQVLVNAFTRATSTQTTYLLDHGSINAIGPINNFQIGTVALNNSGEVLGGTYNNSGDGYPFIWSSGAFTQLAPQFSSDPSQSFVAAALNDDGIVIGRASLFLNSYPAILEDGQLYNLNNLASIDSGWQNLFLTDIASDGTIVGMGSYNGQEEAFLLTPSSGNINPTTTSTPEPTSLSLLLCAALPLLKRRRS